MTNGNINFIQHTCLALAAVFALAVVSVAAPVHAEGGYGYDYTVIDSLPGGDIGWGYDYTVMDSSPTGWGYDYTVMDTPTDFGVYGGGGFAGGGFSPSSFGGGGFTPSFFGGGGDRTNITSTAVSSVYAPSNTCTAPNSCNVDDHSIFNAPTTIGPTTVTVTNPAASNPTIIYQPAPQPYVYSQPYLVYTPPAPYYPPVTYQQPAYRAPYVSLAAVPYTGLELGPIGTALYWSFLVLWCLAAAYLIAVKKVQNKLVASLNKFLFPATVATATAASYTAKAQVAAPVAHKDAPVASNDTIDPFLATQIFRAR